MSTISLPSDFARRSSLKRKLLTRLSFSSRKTGNAPSPEAIDSLVRNAILRGNTTVLESLSEIGHADVCKPLPTGESMLHAAVDANQKQVVLYLLAKGADVNAIDLDGWTALHRSAYNSNINMAKLLLENGADIRKKAGHLLAVDLAMECDANMIQLLGQDKAAESSPINDDVESETLTECQPPEPNVFSNEDQVIDFETALCECQRENGDVIDDVTAISNIGVGASALTSLDLSNHLTGASTSENPSGPSTELLKFDSSACALEDPPILSDEHGQERSASARRGSKRRTSGRWEKMKTLIKRLPLNCDESKRDVEKERRRHQSEGSVLRSTSCVHTPVRAEGTLVRRHSLTRMPSQGWCLKSTTL